MVPADDRVGLDEHQVATPIPADHAGQEPEESVARTEARPRPCGAAQDQELLAQQEVLGDQIVARIETRAEYGGEEAQLLEHGQEIMPPARVFRPHRDSNLRT